MHVQYGTVITAGGRGLVDPTSGEVGVLGVVERRLCERLRGVSTLGIALSSVCRCPASASVWEGPGSGGAFVGVRRVFPLLNTCTAQHGACEGAVRRMMSFATRWAEDEMPLAASRRELDWLGEASGEYPFPPLLPPGLPSPAPPATPLPSSLLPADAWIIFQYGTIGSFAGLLAIGFVFHSVRCYLLRHHWREFASSLRGDDGTEMLQRDGEKSDAQRPGDGGEVEGAQPARSPGDRLEEGTETLGSPKSDGYEETIAAIVDAHDPSGLLEALALPVEPDGPIDGEDPASTPSAASSEDGVISLEEPAQTEEPAPSSLGYEGSGLDAGDEGRR